mmetsp:Transcript_14146/g.26496  ORF Transcript_14146/g.26496 Transcript_14146/m.26496 type:complete len:100 (-) Transcript_14146:128-427(-)
MDYQPPGWGPQPRIPDPERPGYFTAKRHTNEVELPPRGKYDRASTKIEPPVQFVRALKKLFDGNGGQEGPVPQASLRIAYARTMNLREGDVPGLVLKEE